MATPVLFPTSTSPGLRAAEGGGRLINCYAEPLGEGASAPAVIRRAPGLLTFAVNSLKPERGMYYDDSGHLYVALPGTLHRYDSSGVETVVGSLSGSEPVYMSRNNRTPTPDQVVVSNAGVSRFTLSAVTALSIPALPVPTSVCFLEGYFFFTIADDRCYASGLNDVTVNANDVIRCEAKADGLLRGLAYDNALWLFGRETVEVWSSGSNPNLTGFPFNRVTVVWLGLIGPQAVCGGAESGFTTALVFVARDNTVRQMNGYDPMPISPPELNDLIEKTADKTQITAKAFVVSGHSFVTIAGPGYSWTYDISSSSWHERQSYLRTDWRLAADTQKAFDRWIGCDDQTGNLVEISDNAYHELGDPLIVDAQSIAMEAFPARIQVAGAQFSFVNGVGLVSGREPIETDPVVEITWSDDGGNTWSRPLVRGLGKAGQYHRAIRIDKLGWTSQKGRRWRLRISDPVYVGLLRGDMTAAPRQA